MARSPTDFLGSSITDELIKKAVRYKTLGDVLTEEWLGPPRNRKPTDPIKQLEKAALLDNDIANAITLYANLEILNDATLSVASNELTFVREIGSTEIDFKCRRVPC